MRTGSRAAPAAAAAGLTGVIVAVEYVARHVVAPALPMIADLRVNDLLVMGVAYVALCSIVARLLGARDVRRALVGVIAAGRRWETWAGAAAALVLVLVLSAVDRALWGRVALPSFSVPPSSTVVLAGWPWLVAASLFYVNGVLVPVAEEWLWRGLVQPRFVQSLGVAGGIAVTAVLFSVKHALVDASLGRLMAIASGGVVLGAVARRASWRASALSHVVANSLASASVIASSLGAPPCMSPQPERSPELSSATSRALALIEAPDRHEVETLFAPQFLGAIPVERTLDYYRSFHEAHGSCSWQCTTHVDGPNQVRGRLACARGSPYMVIGIETAPPNRVTHLAIVPFAQLLR